MMKPEASEGVQAAASSVLVSDQAHTHASRYAKADFLDACALSQAELQAMAGGSRDGRIHATRKVSSISKADVTRVQPLTFWQQAASVVFLGLGVPNGVFTIPMVTFGIGRLIGNVSGAFQILGVLLVPLIVVPQPFVRSTLQSWMAVSILKYFSFRFIFEERPPTQSLKTTSSSPRPQILVAPPHGVFPYGNCLAMLVWPLLTGHHFVGLAANSALRVPVFKQILRSIGVVNADRVSARAALESFPHTIGISTGGVAEVFFTNHDDECVVLRTRVGLIKLAIRTGADLVPCYLFGNTEVLQCWAGEGVPGARWILERISRKVGFALILIFGRWGLPIPFRIPILGVMGKAIPTVHLQCEEPTVAQITEVQDKLIADMQSLFDRYKGLYGWEDKRLVIR